MDTIKKEEERLWKLFKGIDDNKRGIAQRLIENSAFMAVTLAGMQERIKVEGVTETYTNGATQTGVKKSAVVEVYNSMLKNYTVVNKQLVELLPEASVEADELTQFLGKAKKIR